MRRRKGVKWKEDDRSGVKRKEVEKEKLAVARGEVTPPSTPNKLIHSA